MPDPLKQNVPPVGLVDRNSPIIGLIDRDVYDGSNPEITISDATPSGVAEYSNAGFANDNHNPVFRQKEGYPYPALSEMVLVPDAFGTYYLNKERIGNEPLGKFRIPHFAVATTYSQELNCVVGGPFDPFICYFLDGRCYEDYAFQLVPRALGYAGALLRYFFRGKFQVNSTSNPGHLKLDITNASLLAEDLSHGLLYVLTEASDSDATRSGVSGSPFSLDSFTPAGGTAGKLRFGGTISVEFNVATGVQNVVLAYQGQLGDEADAVVGKVFQPLFITTGPTFFNLGPSSVTIVWSTNLASNSVVAFGTTQAYGQQVSGTGVGTGHQVDLSNLAPSTTYHYRVSSTDGAGNVAMSGDNTFTTLALVSPITVTVTPATVTLPPGGMQAFTATVTGTSNTAVSWSIQEGPAGGTVTSAGVYTAPSTTGVFHVVATSQADSTKSATATVTISLPAPPSAAWQRTGPEGANIASLGVDPNSPNTVFVGNLNGGIWKSNDGGQTWSLLTRDNPLNIAPIFGIKVANVTRTVYAAAQDSVFKSSDGGATWTRSQLPTQNPSIALDVEVNPLNNDTVYATTINAGLFKSTDGASTWSQLVAAPSSGGFNTLIRADLTMPGRLYFGTDHGHLHIE